jgi:hypothetical protein
VEQLYDLLVKSKINYDLAPFDPQAGIIQQIRTPKTIIEEAEGTCLDLALLLAGMCLSYSLLPIIIAVDGHAFLGVSLTNTRDDSDMAAGAAAFENGVLKDFAALQGWAKEGGRYVFLECTGAAISRISLDRTFPEGRSRGRKGTMTFPQACKAGSDQVLKHTRAKTTHLGQTSANSSTPCTSTICRCATASVQSKGMINLTSGMVTKLTWRLVARN